MRAPRAVCTALVVTTKLISPELIHAVHPLVVERLRHPKEHVRKKAVMVLHRFHQLDPKHTGPLAGMDLDQHFRTALCDKVGAARAAARAAARHTRARTRHCQVCAPPRAHGHGHGSCRWKHSTGPPARATRRGRTLPVVTQTFFQPFPTIH